IHKGFQNLVFDKASAPDLQQAQPTRKQAMCKHMVDGRRCKGGDASAVKNQILKFLGYRTVTYGKPTTSSMPLITFARHQASIDKAYAAKNTPEGLVDENNHC
ncbi:MAG TPA: hypothetical protein VFU89_08215, partial [Rhabdochlamydiaceae bacterium]|nr:hypothetical protein [Rhabdochlamydiaceae bacterium]